MTAPIVSPLTRARLTPREMVASGCDADRMVLVATWVLGRRLATPGQLWERLAEYAENHS